MYGLEDLVIYAEQTAAAKRALTRICTLCGASEGHHSNFGNHCLNPRYLEIGQPIYLETTFTVTK